MIGAKRVRAALALIAPMVLVACGNNTTSDKNNDAKENEPITMKIGQQTQPNSEVTRREIHMQIMPIVA